MLRGPQILLRIMTPEEVVPYALHLNHPEGRDKDDFCFVSPAKFMGNHISTSHYCEEEALLAIDKGEAKHVGYARFYLANPAVGNLELDIEFYDLENDNKENRCEAMALLGKYLFDDRPIERLQVMLRPEDETGRKAATDAGFVQEGTLKQMVFVRGEWRDLEIWSVLREELQNV